MENNTHLPATPPSRPTVRPRGRPALRGVARSQSGRIIRKQLTVMLPLGEEDQYIAAFEQWLGRDRMLALLTGSDTVLQQLQQQADRLLAEAQGERHPSQ